MLHLYSSAKNIKETIANECLIEVIQEELQQFEKIDVYELVPRQEGVNMIDTKWVYINKTDKQDNITRNEARLVAKGYTQVERLDFDETLHQSHHLNLFQVVHTTIDGCESAFQNGIL